MEIAQHRAKLIHILQMAYSGEKAAAFAYAGHWRAAWKKEERIGIAKIEQDEWDHRAIIGKMLKEMGAAPSAWRDLMMGTIGSVIFLACFISGWFFPMYFAGRLEHANVHEYLDAAEHAGALGLFEYEKELLRLSDVELEHESYFKERVRGHWLTPLMKQIFDWGPEPQIESK
ncbi:MAG: hypothetical protein K2X27_09945 [Candidatus Obscuribacterales bacterium]|nr:hypothetical protein [Candidatus Obscuribacterales bacterium]